MHNRIAKTGHQVLAGSTFLVIGDQIRLHEYGAPIGEFDRGPGRKRDILKFTHNIDAVFVGQLMQETAGAGGANLVHVEIQGVGIDQ